VRERRSCERKRRSCERGRGVWERDERERGGERGRDYYSLQ